MRSRLLPAAIAALVASGAYAAAARSLPAPSGFTTPIYGESSNEFVQFVGGTETDIGALTGNFVSGGFVGNDGTREYMIDDPNGDLYAVDTTDATATLVGSTGLSGGEIAGPRWDSNSGQSFVEQCAGGASTLYAIDTASGAVSAVGASSGVCIVAIAFDPTGVLYGIDQTGSDLVSIDTSTGSTQEAGVFPGSLIHIAGMEFDSATLYFVAEDAKRGTTSLYELDAMSGSASALYSVPNGFSAFDFVAGAGSGSTPTVSKDFAPSRIAPSGVTLVTITLTNPTDTIATLTAPLDDALPSPMVIGGGAGATTCANGNVSAIAGFAIFELGIGAQIPAQGSCTITVCTTADASGNYVNTIPSEALQTDAGNNAAAASATIEVTADVIFVDGFDGAPGGCSPTARGSR